jgi:sensor histidine kinase YesM
MRLFRGHKMVYKPRTIFFRIGFIAVYAFLLLLLFRSLFDIPYVKEHQPVKVLVTIITLLFIASEGNFLIDKYLNRRMPWYLNVKRRVTIQFLVTLLWTLLAIGGPFTFWYFYNDRSFYSPIFPWYLLSTTAFMLILFNAIFIATNFFRNWRKSLLEVEELKREKLKSDYKLLQDQLNPHFLFNSFNVLISEIKHDPDIATDFARKLSQFYRYVLQSKNLELVELVKELELMEAYGFMHRVRIGDALNIKVEIGDRAKAKKIPPLTLQILLENAIKHNVADENNPLYIKVRSLNDVTLEVSNNIHHKEATHSTQTGLSNIRNRYALLGIEEVKIDENGERFSVIVPLLDD